MTELDNFPNPKPAPVKPDGMEEREIGGRAAWLLPKAVRIVGTAHPNEGGGPSRQTIIRSMRVGDVVRMEREPSNPFDPNAVAVHFNSLVTHESQIARIGYLNRNLAERLAPQIDKGWKPRGLVTRIWQVEGKGTMAVEVNLFEFLDERE